MLEIKVIVEAAEIVQALNNLAAAMGGAKANFSPTAAPISNSYAAAPTIPQQSSAVYSAPAAATAPTVPVQGATTPQYAPTAGNPLPAPGIPLAPAPTFTREQIMSAGATLVDAGRVQELMNLLNSFGVQAVTDLKPEQMGAFATALREMGAKI
jgi:hypothetical protein